MQPYLVDDFGHRYNLVVGANILGTEGSIHIPHPPMDMDPGWGVPPKGAVVLVNDGRWYLRPVSGEPSEDVAESGMNGDILLEDRTGFVVGRYHLTFRFGDGETGRAAHNGGALSRFFRRMGLG